MSHSQISRVLCPITDGNKTNVVVLVAILSGLTWHLYYTQNTNNTSHLMSHCVAIVLYQAQSDQYPALD